jgi:hypothetical protein
MRRTGPIRLGVLGVVASVSAGLVTAAVGLTWAYGGAAQETEKPPAAALNDLERKFQETLSNATLAGKWRLVADGKLGEEREETYTLGAVRKLSGDLWVIQARIQYADKDVTLPVPVRVVWAGDTPVISITDAGLPGLGKYTARVMVYNGLYTGTWFAPDHGGFLTGRVVKESGAGKGSRAVEGASQADKVPGRGK